MSKINSLKNSSEFDYVYKHGKSYANRYLIMYVVPNGSKESRLGISVSKKVGNSVVRHRVTRLIRESYRLSCHMFNNGLDIVVIARPLVKDQKFCDVNSAMLHLFKLHRIICTE